MSHFILKRFNKHDTYNLIDMNILMEKTFKAMQCQKCKKNISRKKYNYRTPT